MDGCLAVGGRPARHRPGPGTGRLVPAAAEALSMEVLAIAWSNVRRMVRERSNIFFVFIFPIALILLIGAQFGGDFDPAIGLFQEDDDPLDTAVAEGIAADYRPAL